MPKVTNKISSPYMNPVLILLILLTVALWVGGVVFISPRALEALDSRAQYQSLELELVNVTNKVMLVSNYSSNESEYVDRTESVLVKAMPRVFDIPLVVGAAVAVLNEHDFVVTGANSGAEVGEGTALSVGMVSIQFEGPVENLDAFLDKLAKVSPMMRSSTINYQLGGGEQGEPKAMVDLTLATYALPDLPVSDGSVESLVIPELVPDDEALYDRVAGLEPVVPVLDLEFLGDENWDPFQPRVE